MYICKICNSELTNVRKLSKHVRDNHKLFLVKEYYDTYLKKDNEDCCVICQNKTDYSGLNIGYKNTCGKSCAAKLRRKQLKQNPEKFNNFVKKISDCVKNEWNTKDQTSRIKNMTKTIKVNYGSMSIEERKKRFDNLNKLPEKERTEMIKLMTETGFLKWWKNATYEQKRNAWDKRNENLVLLWQKYGTELYKKQRETFVSRQKDNDYCPELSEEKMKILFNNLDKIFNV
jgi:hypothetical protein